MCCILFKDHSGCHVREDYKEARDVAMASVQVREDSTLS